MKYWGSEWWRVYRTGLTKDQGNSKGGGIDNEWSVKGVTFKVTLVTLICGVQLASVGSVLDLILYWPWS